MEPSARHARDSRRQCDESANHGQQATKEYRQVSPAREKAVGPVEFAVPHQNPASIPLHQRTPAIASNLIGHQRPEIAPKRSRRRDPQELERPGENQIAGKRHD